MTMTEPEPELIPTPWYLEVAGDLICRVALPEGDVELIITDSMGTPMFKLDIHQHIVNEPAADNEFPSIIGADMDVFNANNSGPNPPEWGALVRGLQYKEST
jgi:hypothetical protein